MRSVLDRFEEGLAVLIAEQAGREFHVPLRYLPDGSKPGMWFVLTVENGTVVDMEVDTASSEAQNNKAEQLIERLRAKKAGSRFKRK